MKKFVSIFSSFHAPPRRIWFGFGGPTSGGAEFVNGHGVLIAEYSEIETGKQADRPQLLEAIGPRSPSKGRFS